MKLPSKSAIAVFVFAGLCTSGIAQEPPGKAPEKLVDFKDIKIQVQKTPDFTLKGGTTDKRVRPKDWIEIEPEFKTEQPVGDK